MQQDFSPQPDFPLYEPSAIQPDSDVLLTIFDRTTIRLSVSIQAVQAVPVSNAFRSVCSALQRADYKATQVIPRCNHLASYEIECGKNLLEVASLIDEYFQSDYVADAMKQASLTYAKVDLRK